MKQAFEVIDAAEERVAGRLSRLGLGSSITCAVLVALGLIEKLLTLVLKVPLPHWTINGTQIMLGASAIIGVGSTALNYYGYSRIARRKERFKVKDEAINQALDVPGKIDSANVIRSAANEADRARVGCGCGPLASLGLALIAAVLLFVNPAQADTSGPTGIDTANHAATATASAAATLTAATPLATATNSTTGATPTTTGTNPRATATTATTRATPTATVGAAATATEVATAITNPKPPTATPVPPTATPLPQPNYFSVAPTTFTWYCNITTAPITVTLNNTQNKFAVAVTMTFGANGYKLPWATTTTANPVTIQAGGRLQVTLTIDNSDCNLTQATYQTTFTASAAGAQTVSPTVATTVVPPAR